MITPKIILEGPDNAGKTTLARRLCDATSCRYFHPGGPPIDDAAEHKCLGDQVVELVHGLPTIIDRVTAISQQVYNPSVTMDGLRQQWIEQALHPNHVILVYCRPSDEWLTKSDRFTWRPEESEAHRQKIIKGQIGFIKSYDRVMAGLPRVVYNFEEADYAENVTNRLIAFLNHELRSREWLRAVMLANRGA